ncbi:MAG: hypothetical protein U0Y68_25880 [Blastocatellia bacterium]
MNGQTAVGASFLPQFTLSVSRSNSGTITATPNGNNDAPNCGGNCSAKFTQGTNVTLTAIPPAGKTFINWSSKDVPACNLSTSPTCTATITGNTSIQAFSANKVVVTLATMGMCRRLHIPIFLLFARLV